jgi:UDP-glucose 4-epimerase
MEDAIKWYGKAYSIRSTILRYFNAAGATLERGEDHRPETHLIPRLLLSALENEPVTLFGSDYPTRDGTAIRDYIHVEDLAKAHLKALDYLLQGGASLTCNLGSGGGYTVREVLEAARKATGQPLQEKLAPRRAGDPAVLVASPELAKTALSWKPERGLEEMVVSAWAWRQRYPGGYS